MIEQTTAQDGDKSRHGMGALLWISQQEGPLRADEAYHALGVDPGCTDFNADKITSMTTLVGYGQQPIAVDQEASTVPVIHFPRREYLLACPDILNITQSAVAEICFKSEFPTTAHGPFSQSLSGCLWHALPTILYFVLRSQYGIKYSGKVE